MQLVFGQTGRETILHIVSGIVVMVCLAVSVQGCAAEESTRSRVEQIETLYQKYKENFQEAPDLSVAETTKRLENDNVILVDNREREEQEVSMIPDAITDEEFERNMQAYRDDVIIVYCTIGNRSGHYAKRLRSQGFEAYNLKGGILSWAHAGKEFVDDQGNKTHRAHVYGSKWSLLPDGYEAVW
jgi:rhodanese-related sulfurtransferase